ncbi:MAG: hypothetical protein IPP77_01850 [Bacteroidetes bacterium]|nr:hypothetical protein [Bacteroidota bacterium]
MDNHQEDKLGMYEKVKAFLTRNTAVLAGVTQIAALQTQLSDGIDAIIDAAMEATEDDRGFTEQKSDERNELEAITLKVFRALSAYWESTGTDASLILKEYLPSSLDAMRDNDLALTAYRLHIVAEPVAAFLTDFNSGPADVNELKATYEQFFTDIPLSKTKTDARHDATGEVQRLMKRVDKILDKLDIYLATFAAVNIFLFNQYEMARTIDHSRGSKATLRRGTVEPKAVEPVKWAAGVISADTVLEFSNTGKSGPMIFYFSAERYELPGSGLSISLSVGKTLTRAATQLGFTATRRSMNIFNDGVQEGNWRVRKI